MIVSADSQNISSSFCVAVSGGVDSMALSFLAKCYSLENNKKVYFFIVDHKLRKNSSNRDQDHQTYPETEKFLLDLICISQNDLKIILF